MIMINQEYEVAAWLRQKVMDMIAGVENARGIGWDDTTPNWMTERAIEKLLDALTERVKGLGTIWVREHNCGSDQHEEQAKFSVWAPKSYGYWLLELEDGRTNAHKVTDDGKLFVKGLAMDHSEGEINSMNIPCPCRPKRKVNHAVIQYQAWPHNEDTRIGMLCQCLSFLHEAMSCAGPRRPRSAVREQLLKCLILLNDEIATVSAAEEIATRSTR